MAERNVPSNGYTACPDTKCPEHRWYRIDSLTGLYSNDTFGREAIRMIVAKPAGTYTLSCFDIDNFKAINAQYGRETGDSVLREIANIAAGLADTYCGAACCMSADHFALLLPSGLPLLLPKSMASVESRFKVPPT